MSNIVFDIGSGLCWGAGAFVNSQVCSTQTHILTTGYGTFSLLALLTIYTLVKRFNRA